jgi:hypothetical protein
LDLRDLDRHHWSQGTMHGEVMITSAVAIRGALASLEQLRTFALDFAQSDPDFAAELPAAADRHERAC